MIAVDHIDEPHGTVSRGRRQHRAGWPEAPCLQTPRLTLEPLRAEHAEEMFGVLDDPTLHTFTGGEPLGLDGLRARYRRLAAGHSPDGGQGWHNWVLRDRETRAVLGTVQATLSRSGQRFSAEIAWVTGAAHQRHGYASEAAERMAEWLRGQGAVEITAYIDPRHEASMRVARRAGLRATDAVRDGETRWSSG